MTGGILIGVLIFFLFINDPVEVEIIETPDGSGFTAKTKHLKTGTIDYTFNYRENIGGGDKADSEKNQNTTKKGSVEIDYGKDFWEIDNINGSK